jgi:hypothetical protein
MPALTDDFVSVPTAARYLGITRFQLLNLTATGAIRATSVEGRAYYQTRDLDKLAAVLPAGRRHYAHLGRDAASA